MIITGFRFGVSLAGIAALILTACGTRISPTSPSASSATVTTAITATATSETSSTQTSGVDVCHRRGNGSYNLISINGNALAAHLSHGDAQPGDAVPGAPGKRFDEACNQVDAVACPCWDEAFLDSSIVPTVSCESSHLPGQFVLKSNSDSSDNQVSWFLDEGATRCGAKGLPIPIGPLFVTPAEAAVCLAQLQARCPVE